MTVAPSKDNVLVPTDAEIERMSRESAAIGARLFAANVRYRAALRSIELTLKSGVVMSIPVEEIAELRHATAKQLRELELESKGSVLHQEELDVDLSVPNLIRDVLGLEPQQRRAGQAKTEAKAAAARANGAKGGRPRKR